MTNRWGKKVETVTDFIFLGSKITVDSDCSHEIKRHLLLGRKAVTNLLLLLLSRFSRFRLLRPHGRQPTRLPRPWDSPGKNTGVGCHFLLQWMKMKSESEAAQSRLTLSDPMDCSLPGSAIHGIFQARVLEWGAIAFSGDKSSQHIKKQRYHFADKGWYSQSYGFSSSRIWTWKVDHKEGWASKNWCFWTVVLEKTLESPLDCKEIQPIHPKGDQPWLFIGRCDGEAPLLWPPDLKSWLTGKNSGGGKDWGQEEKGAWEDEMVGLASLTQWTWVWGNSGRWWSTGKPGVLQSMGLQRSGRDWVTKQQQIILRSNLRLQNKLRNLRICVLVCWFIFKVFWIGTYVRFVFEKLFPLSSHSCSILPILS